MYVAELLTFQDDAVPSPDTALAAYLAKGTKVLLPVAWTVHDPPHSHQHVSIFALNPRPRTIRYTSCPMKATKEEDIFSADGSTPCSEVGRFLGRLGFWFRPSRSVLLASCGVDDVEKALREPDLDTTLASDLFAGVVGPGSTPP